MSSVEDQVAELRSTAEENEWKVEFEYTDKVSASPYATKVREDWPKLLEDIRDGLVDLVICWDVSRLSREMESWPQAVKLCETMRVHIYSRRDERLYRPWVSGDWKTLVDSGVDAEYESRKKSADVRRGVKASAKAGKAHGKEAYGYRRVDTRVNGVRTWHDEINEEQAAIVREIITKIAKRVPLSQLMRDLNKRGVLSPGGGPWSRTTIAHLVNVRYIGIRVHKPKGSKVATEHKAAWPAIMDTPEERKLFAQAQAVLGEEDRKRSAPGAQRYLLSYLMVCETCDGPVNVQPPRMRDGRMVPARYRCLDFGHLSITVTDADTFIGDVLVCERLARPDARHLFAPADSTVEAQAQEELARLESEVEKNKTAYENDVIDADAYGRKRRVLEPKVIAAKAKVAELGKGNELRNLLGDLKEGEFTLEVILPRWNQLGVAAKRTVIKTLLSKISLGPSTVTLTRWSTTEERIQAANNRITRKWVEEPGIEEAA